MSLYDTTDLDWQWDGDYSIDDDGDLGDTSKDKIQSLVHEIMTAVKSEIGDWKANPTYAATLSDYHGEPNSRETGELIKQRVVSVLVSHNIVKAPDLMVRVVPVNINEVLIIVKVQAMSTSENSLEIGQPVVVTLVYDSSENNIFFLPSNQLERRLRGN